MLLLKFTIQYIYYYRAFGNKIKQIEEMINLTGNTNRVDICIKVIEIDI